MNEVAGDEPLLALGLGCFELTVTLLPERV